MQLKRETPRWLAIAGFFVAADLSDNLRAG
jgi:hypothetical protein